MCHWQKVCVWNITNNIQLISPWTKWPPFCRQHVPMHFLEWKYLNFKNDDMSALFQIMAWRHQADKPLSEPMLTHFTDRIYVALGEMSLWSMSLSLSKDKRLKNWETIIFHSNLLGRQNAIPGSAGGGRAEGTQQNARACYTGYLLGIHHWAIIWTNADLLLMMTRQLPSPSHHRLGRAGVNSYELT